MPPEQPNVLVIQADQLRWDCLGAAGHPDVRTPNLDRLAVDGVRYSNAFCPFPVCTPSRYSMLSGQYVHQHGGWTNRCTLPTTLDTFPKVLRRAGYRTRAVGKMHFSPTYLDVGYDQMVLAEQDGAGRYDDDYHRELRAAGLADVTDLIDQEAHVRATAPASYWASFGAGRSNLPEEWHSTTWIGDQALRQVRDWDPDGGNLLHVSFIKPHHPFDPPAPWDELYDPASLTLPPGWTEDLPDSDQSHGAAYFNNERLTEDALRFVLAHYYATITQLDHQIGRLLDHLLATNAYDDTMIVFTADHGEYLGFHHLLLKWGPLYDPVVRVPLLIKSPTDGRDTGSAGKINNELVSLVDIAPTIMGACGLGDAQAENGSSHWAGHDLTATAKPRGVVITENRRDSELTYMVRSRTHKLLAHPDPSADALFDLTVDPLELDNRITDDHYADVVAELRGALTHWLLYETPTPTPLDLNAPQITAPNVPPADAERRSTHRGYFTDATRP